VKCREIRQGKGLEMCSASSAIPFFEIDLPSVLSPVRADPAAFTRVLGGHPHRLPNPEIRA